MSHLKAKSDRKRHKKRVRQIEIMGRKIDVIEGEGLSYNGEPCLGLCNYDEKKIYIERNQPPHTKSETLIHEAAHYFLELTGIAQKLSYSENEVYCQLITAFYTDLKKSKL